jgi:ubiquinone/menaquinone biosynthesis C-methylase UbiE
VGVGSSLRRFGQVFDQVAEEYDKARRGYPPAIVDAAVARGGLAPGSHVLEVGCGTGKLTELLAARELVVDAVDPGENMIAVARRRVGDNDRVRFHVGRFEEIDLPEGAYDAVFSATAFHWIDPTVGWAKAAAHLKPGALLALLAHTLLRRDDGKAHEALRAVLTKHAPDVAQGWRRPRELDTILAGAGERRDNASEVWDWLIGEGRHSMAVPEAAPLFSDVDVQMELTEIEETADQLLAHLRTTSLYFRIDPDRREAFEEDDRRVIESLGGTIRSTRATVLMTARRTESL